ncbi:MAG: hypothetical protein MZV63_03855 [Marinilabiliales bacterium]|nr:hypothetical protein [Marinilabiliales bacterium]
MVLCGTLPYLFSGIITDFIKALFESTSGYTTTGASIIADVEISAKVNTVSGEVSPTGSEE